MSFRKEKKFRVSISDSQKFQKLLLQRGMTKLYEPRLIHSIYFDTMEMAMLFDSEEGTLPRKKVRVRWYNHDTKFNLEEKVSSVEGRFKTVKELKNISSSIELLGEHYFDKQYGYLTPSLKVSYVRSYFDLESMRITFDDNITYQSCKSRFQSYFKDPERVIEIKIPHNCPDDYIEKHIPYSTSRFSKYSRGCLISSGQLSEF